MRAIIIGLITIALSGCMATKRLSISEELKIVQERYERPWQHELQQHQQSGNDELAQELKSISNAIFQQYRYKGIEANITKRTSAIKQADKPENAVNPQDMVNAYSTLSKLIESDSFQDFKTFIDLWRRPELEQACDTTFFKSDSVLVLKCGTLFQTYNKRYGKDAEQISTLITNALNTHRDYAEKHEKATVLLAKQEQSDKERRSRALHNHLASIYQKVGGKSKMINRFNRGRYGIPEVLEYCAKNIRECKGKYAWVSWSGHNFSVAEWRNEQESNAYRLESFSSQWTVISQSKSQCYNGDSADCLGRLIRFIGPTTYTTVIGSQREVLLITQEAMKKFMY